MNNKVLNLRHYCLTVKNLEKSIDFYKTFSPEFVSEISKESGKLIYSLFKKNITVRSAKIHFSNDNRLELIELTKTNSKNKNIFLGFHHICFTVKNIEHTVKTIQKYFIKIKPNKKFESTKIIKLKKNNTFNSKKAKHCYIKDLDNNIIQLAQDL